MDSRLIARFTLAITLLRLVSEDTVIPSNTTKVIAYDHHT